MKKTIIFCLLVVMMFSLVSVAFANGAELTPEEVAAAKAMEQKAYITLGILVIAALCFITEIIPLAVTSMCIPVVLVLTNVVSAKDAFSGLANSNVILFAGMFVIGAALFETGVAKKIGEAVLSVSGGSETKLVLGVMLVTMVLSSVLSNTGTVAVLLPVCIGIADTAGWNRAKILMPMAMMASLGGMITLVGTPPNVTVNAVLGEFGQRQFGFLEYAWVGLPLAFIGLIYLMTIGRKLLPNEKRQISDDGAVHMDENKVYSPFKQVAATVILLGVVVVMATEIIALHVAAVAGAMLCIIFGTLTEKHAYHSIDWTTIFLFAGTLSLATALDKTGAGAMIANGVISIVGDSTSPYVLLTALFWLTAILTQFMSNTASCALLAPIGLQIAYGLNASPHAILMTIAIAASAAFATPIATPPNTLVLGPGGLKFMDYVKIGVPLLIITYIVSMLIIPMVWPFF